MGFGSKTLLLLLGLMCMLGKCSTCDNGYSSDNDGKCVDVDECKEIKTYCGPNTHCNNTNGSYTCWCMDGYKNFKEKLYFKGQGEGQCQDNNECTTKPNICGNGSTCKNLIGSFNCTCQDGYSSASGNDTDCTDINECNDAETKNEKICGENGRCINTNGSFWCDCPEGYTTYGNERMPCSELNCDSYSANDRPAESLGGLADITSMMKNSCLALSNPSTAGGKKDDGETLLEKLLTASDTVLSPGGLSSREHVSAMLHTMEKSIMLIGPQLKHSRTTLKTHETDIEVAVERGKTPPTGPLHLSSEEAALHTDWETAAGSGTYPGFALAALLTYNNLNSSFHGAFEELSKQIINGVNHTFSMSSRVVSVVVSNPSTKHLNRPVNITFKHLEDRKESEGERYICVYWNERGAWSTVGCNQSSTASHTVCTCNHLSSFAVLMAQFDMDHPFALILMTQIGLTISILCLVLSILTFKFCRSIQGTRTIIHLHLCVCLLMGDLIFLAGITQTEPVGGCRFVAAMLHYFFLAVFTWMLLEGVQLYRMVVLVFNATIRPLYLFVTGYGMPLVIVIISGISRPKGYGTRKHCWLSLENGLTWSFFGPVCIIIVINVFFFIITVWKLAQKFTSLNPDLSQLHKIKAFTVTAIAQMCVLGLMWVFGAFLFEPGTFTTVAAYIFTILNSLQGALVFIMHCLLSKQVREEYAHFLSCICAAQKKSYSDLSSTNPSSSQSQGSRSGQHTRESQI